MAYKQLYLNNFFVALTGAIDGTQTTVSIATADASRLGVLSGNNYYVATIIPDGLSNPGFSDVEIIKITAVDTGTGVLTVTRAYEGSAGKIWEAGSRLFVGLTLEGLEALATKRPQVLDVAGTGHTVTIANSGQILKTTNATATIITLPTSATDPSLLEGFSFDVIVLGAGGATIAPSGSDVIVGGTSIAQYGRVSITKIISTTNSTWSVSGDAT